MTIDEPQERRQQPALVLRRRRANPGGDDLLRAALELHRAAVHLVLPARRVAGLAADPNVGSAPILADGGLLGDERTEQAGPIAWNDFDDLHGKPRFRVKMELSFRTHSGHGKHQAVPY